MKFNNHLKPTSVFLYWTDSKGKIWDSFVELKSIASVQPQKKGLQVINGSHGRQIVRVSKVMKATWKVSVSMVRGHDP